MDTHFQLHPCDIKKGLGYYRWQWAKQIWPFGFDYMLKTSTLHTLAAHSLESSYNQEKVCVTVWTVIVYTWIPLSWPFTLVMVMVHTCIHDLNSLVFLNNKVIKKETLSQNMSQTCQNKNIDECKSRRSKIVKCMKEWHTSTHTVNMRQVSFAEEHQTQMTPCLHSLRSFGSLYLYWMYSKMSRSLSTGRGSPATPAAHPGRKTLILGLNNIHDGLTTEESNGWREFNGFKFIMQQNSPVTPSGRIVYSFSVKPFSRAWVLMFLLNISLPVKYKTPQ